MLMLVLMGVLLALLVLCCGWGRSRLNISTRRGVLPSQPSHTYWTALPLPLPLLLLLLLLLLIMTTTTLMMAMMVSNDNSNNMLQQQQQEEEEEEEEEEELRRWVIL
eukprot:COSAG06_NODE_1629_length_8873_cov_6.041486_6_plen_107_part_00